MKSVIIRDLKGEILLKINDRKNGKIDALILAELNEKVTVKIIDDNNKPIVLYFINKKIERSK